MLGKHSKDQPTLGLPGEDMQEKVAAYSCGCGKTYKARGDFRKHSVEMHYGFFVEKSSHYLANLTLIVLPVVNELLLKVQSQQVRRGDEEFMLNREEIPMKELEIDAEDRKLKNKQVKKKQTEKSVKPMMKEEEVKPQEEKADIQSKELVEWNGFRLIKNRRIQSNTFFCGQCALYFSNPQDYVVHCIEICQELKNLCSSHFIYSHLDDQTDQNGKRSVIKPLQDQRKKSPPKEEPVQKYPGKKRGRKKKIVNPEPPLPEPPSEVAAVHYDAETHHQNMIVQAAEAAEVAEPTQEINGLRYLYGTRNDEQSRIYSCGQCRKAYNPSKFKLHINQIHSEIVPKDSSHIIIRFVWRNSHLHRYFPMEQPSDEPNMVWSCPCRPGVMNRASFVEHQMDVHFGISMIYPCML